MARARAHQLCPSRRPARRAARHCDAPAGSSFSCGRAGRAASRVPCRRRKQSPRRPGLRRVLCCMTDGRLPPGRRHPAQRRRARPLSPHPSPPRKREVWSRRARLDPPAAEDGWGLCAISPPYTGQNNPMLRG
jgi:hypothetical protein